MASKSVKSTSNSIKPASTSPKGLQISLLILVLLSLLFFVSVSLILRDADRLSRQELSHAIAQRSVTILLFGIALVDMSKPLKYAGLGMASLLVLFIWNGPASNLEKSYYCIQPPLAKESNFELSGSVNNTLENVWKTWKRQVDEELAIKYDPDLWRFQDRANNRMPSCPFISGDSLRSMADHLFDESRVMEFKPEDVKENDVVFIKSDYIPEYLIKYLDKVRYRHIMLTHNSDFGFPSDKYGDASDYLDDTKIKTWMGQNLKIPLRPKTIPVPIGIGNRYLRHGNIDIMRQKATNSFRQYNDRDILLYVNFASDTNPNRGKILEKVRSIPGSLIVETKKSWAEYLEDVSRSVFVLSPLGNGIDCHRTWEALILGAIPVVQSSTINPLYEDMPVLVVSSMESLNQNILNDFLNSLPKRLHKFTVKPTFCSYWADRLSQLKG